MQVNLHVNEIVLEGLPLSAADTPLLKQAIERRLAEILGASEETNLRQAPHEEIEIRIGNQVDPAALGRDVANGLYGDDRQTQPTTGEATS